MNIRKLCLSALLVLAVLLTLVVPAFAAGGLELSTDYPGLTVQAGDELDFSLDFSNAADLGGSVALSVSSIPAGWEGYFNGGGKEVSRVYVHSGDNPGAVSFHVAVPADTEQGSYAITLHAAGDAFSSSLVLNLDVKEEELGSSALTTQYPEQEGAAGTGFTFHSTIQNNTPAEQSYSFSAETPAGWLVSFKPSGESTQVASVTVPARSAQSMDITITPPDGVEAGEFEIPISAISASETLEARLTVVITGSYTINLSTPSGLLSFDTHANDQTPVAISVTNYGNVALQNLNLTSTAPSGWTVEFSDSTIDVLEPGATKELTAYVTPSKEAMSGDYMLTLTASNQETTDKAEFRVSVKTETVWGVVGVLLILLAIGALVLVFRKFGRR